MWLGYRLFSSEFSFLSRVKHDRKKKGSFQACPVCKTMLNSRSLVDTRAYPALQGSRGRLMHVRGCPFCLQGSKPRKCPVCTRDLDTEGYLVSRITERPGRNHVHVVGCSMCKKGMKQFQVPLS